MMASESRCEDGKEQPHRGQLKKPPSDKLIARLRARAAPVIEAADPLELVKGALRSLGYGGDLTPALIVYLAATSRLLAMRRGSIPVHVLLVSAPSAGKSYTLQDHVIAQGGTTAALNYKIPPIAFLTH